MIGKAHKLQTSLYFKKLKIEIRVFCKKKSNKKSKLYSKIKPRKKAANIKKKELKTKKLINQVII